MRWRSLSHRRWHEHCPPPTTDRTGDNVRIVEWDPPIAIPGLSRSARLWLERARTRPIPATIAKHIYAERAARIQDFVASGDFSSLLGVEPTRDRLDAMPGDARRAVLAFEQRYAQVPGDAALVRGARVGIYLDANGVSIRSMVSSFQPDLDPAEVEVAPAEAVATALGVAAERGTVRVIAPDDPLPLVVLRKPAQLGGARRASEVRRANDRLAYAVRLVTDDAIRREVIEVLVDVVAGEPVTVVPLSAADGPFLPVELVPFPFVVPTLVGDSLINAIICGGWEGQGVDTDLVLRRLSTTFYASEPKPFAMVSCGEPAFERMLNAKDVVTLNGQKAFVDDDDVWIGPDPLLPHAVNTQYWGERALRFFKKSGYKLREGSNQPVRFVAWQKSGMAEDAEFTKLDTPYGSENGVIEVGTGGPHFKTSADPMVLTHELAHSVWRDVLPYAELETEEKAIDEGLADCFAMAGMNDMQQEWEQDPVNHPPHLGYTHLALVDFAPFSFWAGSYVDTTKLGTPGYPNLWDPKKSWPSDWPTPNFRFTHWSGLRQTIPDHEKDSTLMGAVCRLLVTGGPSESVTNGNAVTAGGHLADALAFGLGGVNRQEGFKRLTRLLLFTLIDAKYHPTTFHDFINTLAEHAQALALNEWGGNLDYREKVKRAFAEYGFGRGLEDEPNTAAQVGLLSNASAANLIAAGSHFSRSITGELCTGDEDFFVINEKAGVGDTIKFSIGHFGTPPPNTTFEVRFYRHQPCDLAEPPPKTCAPIYQVYPPLDADPEAPPPSPFVFTGLTGGQCPPFVPCGANYWKLFAGVRMKPGGSCKSKYELSVEFAKRAPGNEGAN